MKQNLNNPVPVFVIQFILTIMPGTEINKLLKINAKY